MSEAAFVAPGLGDVTDRVRSYLASALADVQFTHTEKRIMRLLCDGAPHPSAEVLEVGLRDEEAAKGNLHPHITNIRKKLAPLHHTILCVSQGSRTYYQYVLLVPAVLPHG